MMSGYPTPWIVGPFGEIWVAADVEYREGKWHKTVPDPRIVVTLGGKSQALAEQIVSAVNAAAKQPICTEDDDSYEPVFASPEVI